MERIVRGNTRLMRKYELEEILDVINAKPKNVFCDLGCGEGMLCIWASKRLKFVYGIENYRKNYYKSQNNKKKYHRSNIHFIYTDYDRVEDIPELKKCDIFFCTNGLDHDFYYRLEKFLKPKKVFFVSQYFAPYPIMCRKYGYWYVMKTPFKMAHTEKEWVQYMLGKRKTIKDLLKNLRKFPDYKEKKEELTIIINYCNWICGKHTK